LSYDESRARQANAVEAEVARVLNTGGAPPPLPLTAYVGRYRDPWRGDAQIRLEGGRLVLKLSRTKGLEGALSPFNGNVFIVRWNDRSLNADAYVRFSQGFGPEVEQGGNQSVDDAIEGMTLRSISPLTDFSFDFQDLDFAKIPANSEAP
jgi:hypothetical protein